MNFNARNMKASWGHSLTLLVMAISISACSQKPYHSSPFGVCGGYYSEHDVQHKGDFWVTTENNEVTFHYTNISQQADKKPVWAVADEDSLYYLHIQYDDVTVGCLEQTNYPDWKTQSITDEKWNLNPGQTVTGRFSQDRVWRSIRNEVPYAVMQPGNTIRFNFNGFASNACILMPRENSPQLDLKCENTTSTEQRLKENKKRKPLWDRIFSRNQKEVWEG